MMLTVTERIELSRGLLKLISQSIEEADAGARPDAVSECWLANAVPLAQALVAALSGKPPQTKD